MRSHDMTLIARFTGPSWGPPGSCCLGRRLLTVNTVPPVEVSLDDRFYATPLPVHEGIHGCTRTVRLTFPREWKQAFFHLIRHHYKANIVEITGLRFYSMSQRGYWHIPYEGTSVLPGAVWYFSRFLTLPFVHICNVYAAHWLSWDARPRLMLHIVHTTLNKILIS